MSGIDRDGALWAYTMGCVAAGSFKHCPFEADTAHARFWLDGREGRPFRGLAS